MSPDVEMICCCGSDDGQMAFSFLELLFPEEAIYFDLVISSAPPRLQAAELLRVTIHDIWKTRATKLEQLLH